MLTITDPGLFSIATKEVNSDLDQSCRKSRYGYEPLSQGGMVVVVVVVVGFVKRGGGGAKKLGTGFLGS